MTSHDFMSEGFILEEENEFLHRAEQVWQNPAKRQSPVVLEKLTAQMASLLVDKKARQLDMLAPARNYLQEDIQTIRDITCKLHRGTITTEAYYQERDNRRYQNAKRLILTGNDIAALFHQALEESVKTIRTATPEDLPASISKFDLHTPNLAERAYNYLMWVNSAEHLTNNDLRLPIGPPHLTLTPEDYQPLIDKLTSRRTTPKKAVHELLDLFLKYQHLGCPPGFHKNLGGFDLTRLFQEILDEIITLHTREETRDRLLDSSTS